MRQLSNCKDKLPNLGLLERQLLFHLEFGDQRTFNTNQQYVVELQQKNILSLSSLSLCLSLSLSY